MRLLLVEDQARSTDTVAEALRGAGHELDVASDGLAGRHFIEQHTYQLIVLDAMLPGHTGWRLLKQVRQLGVTPLLFLTTGESMEDRLRGLELEADGYLLKPFTNTELLARVELLLRRNEPVVVSTRSRRSRPEPDFD